MARFHGRFDYTIDSKGRVNIPAKFRSALNPDANEMFTICRAPNDCLRAYPRDKWAKFEDDLESRPEDPSTLRYKRMIYDSLTDSTLDGQGRVSLSAYQLKIAKITKEVTLVGQSNFIEIWNTEAYDAYLLANENFDQMHFDSIEAGLRKNDR